MEQINQITGSLLAKTNRPVVTQNHNLEKTRRKLLANSLQTACNPECPICGGIGYYRNPEELPINHPDFGKLIPCPNMYQEQIKMGADRYGLFSDEIENLEWRSLLDINDCPGIAYRVKSILDSKQGGFIYLWGEHGLAKSMMLKIAVAYSVRDLKRKAAYANMVSILDEIKSAYDKNNPSEESLRLLDWWAHIDVLSIDEFDRINETEWAKERRFRLIDTRYVSGYRGETTTIIASNRSPNDQEGYLRSRIKDGRFEVIFLKGEDARPGMPKDFRF